MLTVKNLKKKYGDVLALKDISLKINQGDIVGLLGPNGAGKSTTISIISTLIQADSGQVTFRGQDVLKDPKKIQKHMGLVPQELALYENLTGLENLKFWGKAYGLKGEILKSKIVEISHVIGIQERLKDPVKTYSGGMKRRLNIGISLMHDPELLILDEPTVGIDPQSRNHILETIKRLNKEGTTVIYTTHYMEEVEFLCNRVYILDQGEVISQGSKSELLQGVKVLEVVSDGVLDEDFLNEDWLLSWRHQGNLYHLSTKEEVLASQRLLDYAQKNKIKIDGLSIQEENLENIFLKLTGRALRD